MRFFSVNTSNIIFAFHNISGLLLLIVGIVSGLNQYFRPSIHCFGDEDVPQGFAEEYCIGETFTVQSTVHKDVGTDIPFPGIDKSAPGQIYNHQKLYRWVPFSFIFQSLWFLIVHIVWTQLIGNKINYIVGSDDVVIARKRLHQSIGKNWFFALKYLQANALLIVNTSLQLSYLNIYLDGNHVSMKMVMSEQAMVDVNFPKVASCTFYKYGRSGNVERHNLLCVLPLNELFVKIYCFDYYLLTVLRVMTVINFLYYCLLSAPVVPTLLFQILVGPEYQSKALHKLSAECFVGDWLVITLVMQSMDPLTFKDIIEMKKSKETFTGDLCFGTPTHVEQMQVCEVISRNSNSNAVIEFLN